MATQTPLSPPPSPPILPVRQLHAGVNPEKEEDDEDPVPLMKQLGACAKPYIALQVIDQDLGRVTEVFCVYASYHIKMKYIICNLGGCCRTA